MGRVKISRTGEGLVIYSTEHWELLKKFRENALKVTSAFAHHGIDSLTYGSIARGDVNTKSDIDIILLTQIPSYRVELILDETNLTLNHKKIIQATPNDVIKAHFELDREICVTSLLTDFTSSPFEFYRFGGALHHEELQQNKRVPGVDKRLILIEPNDEGHRESSLIERKYEASKILGISQAMVDQRIRVLSRRDKIGRTGIFLNRDLGIDENVEEELRKIARKNPLIRRRLNRK